MSKRAREEKNNLPSSSLKKPKAEVFAEITNLAFLQNAHRAALKIVDDIAVEAFGVLVDCKDQDILEGQINIKHPYTTIMNNLLRMARDPETGAIRQLNSELVKDRNPKLFLLVSCMSFGEGDNLISGTSALETFCDVVNKELEVRVPQNHLSSIHSAKPLFAGDHQQPIAVN